MAKLERHPQEPPWVKSFENRLKLFIRREITQAVANIIAAVTPKSNAPTSGALTIGESKMGNTAVLADSSSPANATIALVDVDGQPIAPGSAEWPGANGADGSVVWAFDDNGSFTTPTVAADGDSASLAFKAVGKTSISVTVQPNTEAGVKPASFVFDGSVEWDPTAPVGGSVDIELAAPAPGPAPAPVAPAETHSRHRA